MFSIFLTYMLNFVQNQIFFTIQFKNSFFIHNIKVQTFNRYQCGRCLNGLFTEPWANKT